ncbi:hypothetical protein [Vogesella oryzae]|uniref:hypothetical protein n=1 Tax=Vogesella oryzae TaxID=1735285 RepID=UPI001581FC34|nr:hypothetical protein [Vogesella oryzae]
MKPFTFGWAAFFMLRLAANNYRVAVVFCLGMESAARMLFEVAGSARQTGEGAGRRPLATPLALMVRETPAKTAFARRRQFTVC